jgi:hypothetical protein
MNWLPRKVENGSCAITNSADGLAFATTEDTAVIALETSPAQPFPAAGASVARFLRRMVGAMRGYPHGRGYLEIPCARSAVVAGPDVLTCGSGIVFDQRAAG